MNNLSITSILLGLAFTTCSSLGRINQALAEGWSQWQEIQESSKLPFDSGFTNSELGTYLDFTYFCKEEAEKENTKETYWYRLDDVVLTIGTGQVELGCKVNEKFITTYTSTAILTKLNYPVCIQVQSDESNGIRIRESYNVESKVIGFLSNGTNIILKSHPALIMNDSSGRLWLEIEHNGLQGWTSLRKKEGENINFKLCNNSE